MSVAAALIWDTSSDKSRKAGIRWKSSEGEIDRLNAIVRQKTQELVLEASKTGTALSPEVQAVVDKPEDRVYKERWTFLPFMWFALSTCMILFCKSSKSSDSSIELNSPLTVLLCFVFEFFWYDLFSGVLHVVLDNPDFIHNTKQMGFPILHEPCLEFQWHHHIPFDLTVKSFLETCGDLNMIVAILFGVFGTIGYFKPDPYNPTFVCLVGWKLIMSYFGQLCHCMSHMPLPYIPKWVTTLQNWGLMVSNKEHMRHHKNYDDNFCIGCGIANPLIASLRGITTNKWVWLGFFGLMLVGDVPLANHLLTSLFKTA